MKKEALTVLDLFCGCGGLSYGFVEAGYKVVLGLDNNAPALETFVKNHKGSQALNIDLSRKDIVQEIQKKSGLKSIDVIVGGPPCQGFSLTGARNFDDERNKLYLAVFRIVSGMDPKAFLIENVPGLTTLYGGQVRDEILKRFKKLGYNVEWKVLCAADYGVPQMRKRVFFVGLKKELGTFEFPTPTHTPETYVTCSQAIGDLPALESELGEEKAKYKKSPATDYQLLMRGDCSELLNHVATKHTDKVKNVIAQVPEGGNHKDLPKGVGTHRKFNEAWTRYHSDRPSRTIDTGHRNHFHYKHNRIPTVRENARLQSFPDCFAFCGNRTQQNRQVGNAVPPLLGFSVAQKLKKYI